MRRETLWGATGATIVTIAAASTSVLAATLGASALALRPFTVVRVRGWWHVQGDQLAGTEAWGASMGQCVVSEQASAVGITAVPTPETERASDLWSVFETTYGVFSVSSAIGLLETGIAREFDSRAMRKVEDGEDFITVFETPSIVASGQIRFADRFLIKLH